MKPLFDRELGPHLGPATHGAIFAAFLIIPAAIPVLRIWPLLWLVPLACYFAVIASVPKLRRSMCWLKVGRITRSTVAVTMGVALFSSAALILYQILVYPDLHAYRAALPSAMMGNAVVAGIVFSLLNPLLEEMVFRGVLFDGVKSQWGSAVAVLATAIIFGCGHLRGYPPGEMGAVLAGIYGVVLGALRVWTCGLALPFAAHIVADATIYSIVIREGVR